MKTIHKLFLITTIALGLGFVACNDANDAPPVDDSKANTHVSVTLKLSTNPSSRALPEDYNALGVWAGKDLIKTIAVYLVDGSSVTYKSFNVGDGLEYEVTNNGTEIKLVPKKNEAAIRTTAGNKKVYVLINGATEVVTHLNKTPVAEFEDAYQKIALKLANVGTATTSTTSASKLAMKDGVANETIVMTNVDPKTLNVVANVTAAETITETATKNRVSLEVERAVARAMVTTEATTFNVPDPNTNGATSLGTISNITWVVAQGENSLFVQRKADWATPSFVWFPTGSNYNTEAGARYDYSGLFEGYQAAPNYGGTLVPTFASYPAAGSNTTITAELDSLLSGKFVLPTTHTAGLKAESSYKKGNTAYVLVRAKFAPATAAYADGGSYTANADFFVGANGKFYTSATNAVTVANGGVVGQTVAKYVGGKVLYYAWLNPDNVPDWYNSPVLRNNIYHIHITGFKNLGTNWNPLFPEDPDDPKTPEEGGNPDPKPGTENEPPSPIDPEDPLTTPETWMSVDVKVLPWKVHSYNVDLGI